MKLSLKLDVRFAQFIALHMISINTQRVNKAIIYQIYNINVFGLYN